MKIKTILAAAALFTLCFQASAQEKFNGLNTDLGNIYRLSDAQTRSISAENYTGEKGKGGMAKPELPATRNVNNASWAARDLGETWKVNPYINIDPKETITIADIEGPGAIQQMWLTTNGLWRWTILRIYWDDEPTPSVECPMGDFFCMGWNEYAPIVSAPICVNPGLALNSYWQMPFRKKCKITIENLNEKDAIYLYYQINYTLTEVPEDAAYFHAQFRRTRYDETSNLTFVDGIKGQGQYVGTYLAMQLHNNGWWGEGEVKFYIDGDKQYPTICGTGTEDYFCGSHNFDRNGQYTTFTTPYSGLCQVIRPDGNYRAMLRVGMYRWHIVDPIRFKKDLKVTIQDLGWRHDGRYLPQHSDISATTFWYQAEPHAKFPTFPTWRDLETY